MFVGHQERRRILPESSIKDLNRAHETSGNVWRKDDPYLDPIAFPDNVIAIEVKGHHLAGFDDLAIEFAQDIAFAVEKRAADCYASGSSIGSTSPARSGQK